MPVVVSGAVPLNGYIKKALSHNHKNRVDTQLTSLVIVMGEAKVVSLDQQ